MMVNKMGVVRSLSQDLDDFLLMTGVLLNRSDGQQVYNRNRDDGGDGH
jgi:hypothetical protein